MNLFYTWLYWMKLSLKIIAHLIIINIIVYIPIEVLRIVFITVASVISDTRITSENILWWQSGLIYLFNLLIILPFATYIFVKITPVIWKPGELFPRMFLNAAADDE